MGEPEYTRAPSTAAKQFRYAVSRPGPRAHDTANRITETPLSGQLPSKDGVTAILSAGVSRRPDSVELALVHTTRTRYESIGHSHYMISNSSLPLASTRMISYFDFRAAKAAKRTAEEIRNHEKQTHQPRCTMRLRCTMSFGIFDRFCSLCFN